MGVTVLQPFNVIDGKTGPQTIDILSKRLLALGAVQSGYFIVDCETYMPVQHQQQQHGGGASKAVHVFHNSEYPASTFAILDTGAKQISLVADGLFDFIMLKMTFVYTSKKQTKIESKGVRFEYGDFLIKLGSVTMAENFKGILIEAEYRPCAVPSNCWELLRELLQGFLGQNVANTIPLYFTTPSTSILNIGGHPNAASTKQSDTYQPIDTICQYLDHFTTYRKQTITNVPISSAMRT